MGPALVAAFGSIGVALIMVVVGPLVQRLLHTDAPDDDLDVLHAMSGLVAQQAEQIGDLQARLHACEIRAAECEARERAQQ